MVHRLSLRIAPCEYSKVDFLTPVELTLPYRIINGKVVRHHTKASAGARHPLDVSTYSQYLRVQLIFFRQRRQLTKGTQTEDGSSDADAMLLDIDPLVESREPKGNTKE